jgi:O-antigen ligase
MASPIHTGSPGTVSDRTVLSLARLLRVLSAALTFGLGLLLTGSVLAFGAVHPWAKAPLFYTTGVLALIAIARGTVVIQLRQRLGRSQFAFHSSGRWIVLDVDEPYGMRTWSFDLDRPLVPSVPLLLPGAIFAAWVVLQLVPLPPGLADAIAGVETLPGAETDTAWRPISVSPELTVSALVFLAWALVLHVVASSALASRESERRFRRFLAVLGLALAAFALVQKATGTRRVYGLFTPSGQGLNIFGPFVNRNHFAFYMLMVTPIAFGLFGDAYRRYRARVGMRANVRRWAVTLSSREGQSMLYATVPALAAVSALVATTSRGGLIAFAGGLLLAALALWRRRGTPLWVFAAVFTLVALSWFGTDRIEARLMRTSSDAPGRTLVWQDTLDRMSGRWIGGSGFNTFATAVYRASAWDLPAGAAPWTDRELTIVNVPRAGFRTTAGIPGIWWYRETHNDYLQILAETGAVGLMLAIWAIARVLGAAGGDPWLMAALAAVFMHSFVDFGLQIPAIVALFVVLAAIKPHAAPR